METRERTDLAAYLHYGYLPRVAPGYRDLAWARVRAADVAPAAGLSRAELVAEGVQVFRAACGQPAGALHVVPLSGGVDSRLILATLLAAGLRERIVTVTFGIPGAYDFEIAAQVARAANVRHEAVDLTGSDLTRAELLAAARRAPWTFLLEVHYNQLVQRRFGAAATYWSGILANSLAGADLSVPCPDWASACRTFAAGTRIAHSVELAPPGFHPEEVLPAGPLLTDSPLTALEQLYMFVRYPGRNDPAMLPAGFDVRTPFREPAWVNFMLRIPAELRRGEGLYRAIAARMDPALYALPLKNCLGFPLATPAWRIELRRARLKAERLLCARYPATFRFPNPKLNYADFDAELRTPSALGNLVEDSLRRLAARGVLDWLDPLALWERHARRRANHGDALTLLASLELNLAARETPVRAL